MQRTHIAIAAAVSLMASAAFAQDTSEDGAQDAPAADGAEQTQPGGELALGQPAGPQPGQIYARENHGDFQVRCIKAPEGQTDLCQLFQRMNDQTGNPTGDINFFDVEGGGQMAGGATVVTPLQTLLTANVRLSVDGGAERIYPFSYCDQQGCYARMGFTEPEMAQFRAGAKATIKIRPAAVPDQDVTMELSLTGFTAGFQSVAIAE